MRYSLLLTSLQTTIKMFKALVSGLANIYLCLKKFGGSSKRCSLFYVRVNSCKFFVARNFFGRAEYFYF